MNFPCLRSLGLAFALLGMPALPLHAEEALVFTSHLCARAGHAPAAVDSPDYRKYVPDRKVDILHLALDVTPDFGKRTVAGRATLTFKPIARPLDELRLDAVNLTVRAVTCSEKLLGHQATDREIIVTFATPVAPGKEVKLEIEYHATPRRGLYFRTPEMGYATGDMHLFTQGEVDEARHWYPSFDWPNEKFTSEITCRVPADLVVLSNGRQVSSQRDAASGLTAVRWLQDKPHSNYLLSLLAGRFKKIEDQHRDIPMAFWTPASEIGDAGSTFRETKDMMAFFERELGVPYPWAKYDQVCVHDFGWGGMENTSITTLNNRTLFRAETENLVSSTGLVAHELAHQWFGDLVTCKDWSHIWLNEGFATYYAHLYTGHKDGRDEMLWQLWHTAQSLTGRTGETRGIVWRKFGIADEMFNHLAYAKGGWVLHMLRSQLGADLYRRCIQTYLERHQFGSVVTADLVAVVEELSGRSWEQFFDQWVHHAQHPLLDVAYSWDERAKLAKITVRQTQKISEEVPLFRFPLPLRFKSKAGVADRIVTVKAASEDFYFPLDQAPEIVRVDPEVTVLAKINFTPPAALLLAQLADKDDALGRAQAAGQLATRKDAEAVAKLKQTLNSDPFHGARSTAADSLRKMHTDEALGALVESQSQTDARVRNAVVTALAGFYHPQAADALGKILAGEKNPVIQAAALRGLGAYGRPEVRATLLKYLATDSFRQRLAEAAIAAMRTQDDPVFLAPLRDALAKRGSEFPTPTLTSGLDTLAFLARNETKKEEARRFLVPYVNSPRTAVKLAAIRALGTLGDPAAIPVLEKFSSAAKDHPETQAAEQALAALNAARKPAEQLQGLRNEVLQLQGDNRRLGKELSDLKQQLDAKTSAAGKAAKK